jgi:hypothetical protein
MRALLRATWKRPPSAAPRSRATQAKLHFLIWSLARLRASRMTRAPRDKARLDAERAASLRDPCMHGSGGPPDPYSSFSIA